MGPFIKSHFYDLFKTYGTAPFVDSQGHLHVLRLLSHYLVKNAVHPTAASTVTKKTNTDVQITLFVNVRFPSACNLREAVSSFHSIQSSLMAWPHTRQYDFLSMDAPHLRQTFILSPLICSQTRVLLFSLTLSMTVSCTFWRLH